MRPALVALAALLAALSFGAAEEKQPPPAGHALSLAGGKEPVRLRLEVVRDGKPLDGAWEAFLDRLFDHFDRDGDGSLSKAEAGRVVPLPLPDGKELVIDFDKLDADRDGKASRAELRAFCRAGGFTPVVVVVAPPTAEDAALASLFFGALDADRDGKLTAAELKRAPRALRKYDLNEDESLDLAELLSAVPPRSQPDAARVKAVAGGDKDAVLRIDLGAKAKATLEGKGHGGLRLTTGGEGRAYRLRGVRGGWWLTFRPERTAPDVRSAGDFLVAQFADALGDRKGLSKAELDEDASLSGLADLFAHADRDGDGVLTLPELKAYVSLVEAGAAAQTWVTVSDRGRNPFRFLDRDGDGRLGHVELSAAAELLGGESEASRLPEQFDLAFGGPAVKTWGGVPVPLAKRAARKPAAVEAPAWFVAMDRNGDGVVSRAEFVGPPEVFRELDADGDGVISAAEARAAKR